MKERGTNECTLGTTCSRVVSIGRRSVAQQARESRISGDCMCFVILMRSIGTAWALHNTCSILLCLAHNGRDTSYMVYWRTCSAEKCNGIAAPL